MNEDENKENDYLKNYLINKFPKIFYNSEKIYQIFGILNIL